MLTFAGSLPRKKGRGNRLSRGQSCRVVCNDSAYHPGAPGVPVALNIREARHSLDHRVIGSLVGIRAIGSISGDRYVDDIASNTSYHFFTETYTLGDTRTEVMNEHLRSSYQPL